MPIALYVTDIRSLYDARFYAALGAQWLGVQLGRFAERAEELSAIQSWIYGVEWVAEWGNQPIARSQAHELGIQLHSVDYPHPNWKEADFVSIDIHHWDEIAEGQRSRPIHWILTNPHTWERIHLVQLRKATGWHYLLLSLPDQVDLAVQIIRSVQPHGVVFKGFEESEEGIQYMQNVERILEEI